MCDNQRDKGRILVSSDLGARGIDCEDLNVILPLRDSQGACDSKRVFENVQQIKDMGHEKDEKLEKMEVKSLNLSLTHPDNKNWNEELKLKFLVNSDIKNLSLKLDKLAGCELYGDIYFAV